MPEHDSSAALRLRGKFDPPVVLTHLHRVELVTAWHLKVFRNELDRATVELALGDLDRDVETGVWMPPEYDLADVHFHAETLAKRHAPTMGTRTLDILHVAAATLLGASRLVTGDRRQAALAKATGLDVTTYRPRA